MPTTPDGKHRGATLAFRLIMYGLALSTGLALVLVGHVPTPEASWFLAPFLVVFEEGERRRSR